MTTANEEMQNTDGELEVKNPDPSLHNADLAPIPKSKRRWGWFEIFNVWTNDIQSLFGYTLAASLFLSFGLDGWFVLIALILAGAFVMWLVNLSGEPSVKYGVPYPVMARASMGVRGANFPAMVRAVVAIFWYGAQTYFASTALALLLNSIFGIGDGITEVLGLTYIGWISIGIVWLFQIILFWRGIEWIRRFLNFAGPFVYAVMIALAITIWVTAGSGFLSALGDVFSGGVIPVDGDGNPVFDGGQFAAFVAVFGTMVAYFAAVVINYGDFSRFVKTESGMRFGNLIGLPLNMAIFSIIAIFVTAGAVVLYGEAVAVEQGISNAGSIQAQLGSMAVTEQLTNPTDIVARVDNLVLTIAAAIVFFAATVGINLVANFIPPAYDLANLAPRKINFRIGGLITSAFALVIAIFWVSFISDVGIFPFVNTLGAILAPVYGIMIVDYYLVKKRTLNMDEIFSADSGGRYHYSRGWHLSAIGVFTVAAVFSVLAVWLPGRVFDLPGGDAVAGFAWIIGAVLGGGLYYIVMTYIKTRMGKSQSSADKADATDEAGATDA